MNYYIGILIKLLILLVFVIVVIAILFFAKITNFSFSDFNKEETKVDKSSKEISHEESKKIEDSLNQREERIKSLKEVGKKLGG